MPPAKKGPVSPCKCGLAYVPLLDWTAVTPPFMDLRASNLAGRSGRVTENSINFIKNGEYLVPSHQHISWSLANICYSCWPIHCPQDNCLIKLYTRYEYFSDGLHFVEQFLGKRLSPVPPWICKILHFYYFFFKNLKVNPVASLHFYLV